MHAYIVLVKDYIFLENFAPSILLVSLVARFLLHSTAFSESTSYVLWSWKCHWLWVLHTQSVMFLNRRQLLKNWCSGLVWYLCFCVEDSRHKLLFFFALSSLAWVSIAGSRSYNNELSILCYISILRYLWSGTASSQHVLAKITLQATNIGQSLLICCINLLKFFFFW